MDYYTLCNDKIIIHEYLQILEIILKTISDTFSFYDYNFIHLVKEKFVSYYKITETKHHLLNYPIQFMHLSFYEIYSTYIYQPLCIHHFSKYFMKYQTFSEYKYTTVINQLINQLKKYNSIENLVSEIDSLILN
jgi:hypothetical protein